MTTLMCRMFITDMGTSLMVCELAEPARTFWLLFKF